MPWVITQAILFIVIIFLPVTGQLIIPSWLAVTTKLMSIIGFIILIRAIYDLRRSLSVNPTPVKNGRLQMHGIYSQIRHPMYLSVWLILGGGILHSGSYLKFSLFAVLVIFFIIKTKHEEKLLNNKYPDYKKYITQVGAFWPKFMNTIKVETKKQK